MKSVLFDLYGTLIDIHTEEESITFWKKFSNKTKKYHHDTSEVLKQRYQSICHERQCQIEEIDILKVFEELFSIEEQEAKKVALIYRKTSTQYIRLYKGVKKLLKKLTEEGCKIYVLSNAQAAFTIPELKKLKIYSYFSGIAISSNYGVKKPNLDFYKRAIADFNLEYASTVMIGNDYDCDILPAETLGLETIFIVSNLTPANSYKLFLDGFNGNSIYKKILGGKR